MENKTRKHHSILANFSEYCPVTIEDIIKPSV